MTIETALLTAISAVTTALVAVVKILWDRSNQCEKDRMDLRNTLEKYIGAHANAEGRLEAFDACPATDCPFQRDATTKTARVPRYPLPKPSGA